MPSGEKESEPGPAALENGSRVWYNMLRESIEEEILYEIRYRGPAQCGQEHSV